MKILILTTGLNNDKNSSWIVYAKFIKILRRKYDAHIDIICFSPSLLPLKKTLGEKIITTFLRDKIVTASVNRLNRKYSWWITNYYAKRYSKKIIKHIQKNNIDRLWIHSESLTLLILEVILKYINLPYHLTIYDDPFTNRAYFPYMYRFEPVLRRTFLEAKSIDTPTIMLALHYVKMGYIKDKCILAESLVGTFKEQPKVPIIRKNVRKIGLIGSIFGVDALNAFLYSLGEILKYNQIEFHLRTNVPKVYLSYIFNNFKSIAKNTLIKPFIAENDLPLKLQQYDLLYLPMMFDEKYRFKTNTSFPSKTHNYLASGIPIIVHAPESSSLFHFFKTNNIGHLIGTLHTENIVNSFNMLLEQEYRDVLSNNIQLFNKSSLSNDHVRKLYQVIFS